MTQRDDERENTDRTPALEAFRAWWEDNKIAVTAEGVNHVAAWALWRCAWHAANDAASSATRASETTLMYAVFENLPYLENLIITHGHSSPVLSQHTAPCGFNDFCLIKQAQKGADAIRAAMDFDSRHTCRHDDRCQYAIDCGAEGMGHCPPGKCAMPPDRRAIYEQRYEAESKAGATNEQAHDIALEAVQLAAYKSGAIREIAAERQRQIDREGWDQEHDNEHPAGSLAGAGMCYAQNAVGQLGKPYSPVRGLPAFWPWDAADWKPKDARRDLVRAAALIAAELDRMSRSDSDAKGKA